MQPQHRQQPQQWPPHQQPVQQYGQPPRPPYPPYPTQHRARKKGLPVWGIVGLAIAALFVLGVFGVLVDAVVSDGPTATASASPAAATGVPTPDAEQRAAYLAALQEIDPGLVANEDRAIRRGRAVCDRIINPRTTPSVEEYTVAALSGGTTTINQAQARQVIKAVKAWCR